MHDAAGTQLDCPQQQQRHRHHERRDDGEDPKHVDVGQDRRLALHELPEPADRMARQTLQLRRARGLGQPREGPRTGVLTAAN